MGFLHGGHRATVVPPGRGGSRESVVPEGVHRRVTVRPYDVRLPPKATRRLGARMVEVPKFDEFSTELVHRPEPAEAQPIYHLEAIEGPAKGSRFEIAPGISSRVLVGVRPKVMSGFSAIERSETSP